MPPPVDFNPVSLLHPVVAALRLVRALTPSEHRFKIGIQHESSTAVTHDSFTISPGSRFRAAMMQVANVYRKSKRTAVTAEESRQQHPALRDPQGS